MMLQNYTYVDPFMDPVVLLTLLLGLVFLAAAMVVFFAIRSIPASQVSGPERTPNLVPPNVNRVALAPSSRHAWPGREVGRPERDERVARSGSHPRKPRRERPIRDAGTNAPMA